MTALPDLGHGGVAYGLDGEGRITGTVHAGEDYPRPWDGREASVDQAALRGDGTLTVRGDLGGPPRGEGRAVGPEGLVVGTTSMPLPEVDGEDVWQRAAVAAPGADALTDAGGRECDVRSFLFDVKASGQAAGFGEGGNRRHGDGVSRAAVWTLGPDVTVEAASPLPPFAGGRRALAPAIDGAGMMVGRGADAEGRDVAVAWPAGGAAPEALPGLAEHPGPHVRARQVDAAGRAVGELRSASGEAHATLRTCEEGDWVRHDLRERLVDPGGWDLEGAAGIDEAGRIAGRGSLGGATRAVLPTPEG